MATSTAPLHPSAYPEHEAGCPAEKLGLKPAFHFSFVPLREGRMGTIVVQEQCPSCTYRLVYVEEKQPLWRFARALSRTLHAYWITYGHRNQLWDDEAT